MITKKDLKRLGFKKNKVCREESGSDAYVYYTLEIGTDYRKFCLIVNEIEKGKDIIVKIFEYGSFAFVDLEFLETFIGLLLRAEIDATLINLNERLK